MSSAYHPQTDGQTEAVNKCLETYLRCLTGSKPKQWSTWLPWAEFWYNTTYHGSIRMTPFRALYGREPPPLLRGGLESTVEEVRLLMEDRNQMLDELQFQLNRAQNRMKQAADKKRRDVTFEVGDFVFLKIQPSRMRSLATRPNQKLGARFYGPYEVLEKIGAAAYKLRLPASAKIHPIFHVSLLKKSLGSSVEPQSLPESLTEEGELLVEPEQVLDSRMSNQGHLEVLIKWQHLPEFESTWERADKLQLAFPSFHLEDKVALHGEGIVTNQERSNQNLTPFKFTYRRRGKHVTD
ncbi:hypothetical protein S83_019849 [Arachis hypogaea]